MFQWFELHCVDKERIYCPVPGYYMSLSRNSVQRAGDRAFFVSREMKSGSRPQCLSFWYVGDSVKDKLPLLRRWTEFTIDANMKGEH